MINRLQYISQETVEGSHTDHIRKACEAGCNWIQLRIKDLPEQNILPVAIQAKNICDQYGARLIINDYPHIAVAVEAAGVHVGKADMSVARARAITGPHMIVGGTANTAEDIIRHAADSADYVGLGPFRFTTTKKNLSPVLGSAGYIKIIAALQQLRITIPVIAIGGILTEDIPGLIRSGIHGVAVSGLITHATDKKNLVQHIHELLNTHAYDAITNS